MTKERFLVLQHVKSEGLGVFENVLKERGIGHETVKLWEGDRVPDTLKGYRGFIVMGGPMGVYEEDKYLFLRDEIKLIKKAIAEDFPTIGVCLGSQLIAKASGARVYPGDEKEIGWYEINVTEEGIRDEVFKTIVSDARVKGWGSNIQPSAIYRPVTVFQWHGDTFDLPEGAVRLATSEAYPNQAFRIGKRIYALQFHIEVTESMIKEWFDVNDEEVKGLKGKIDLTKILNETDVKIYELNESAENFLNAVLNTLS